MTERLVQFVHLLILSLKNSKITCQKTGHPSLFSNHIEVRKKGHDCQIISDFKQDW